ncbi:cytochrome-c oxidase, cbb3-type subunit III [Aurantiacibacter sp. D1-12]|uniref:cytochrome-c oxidase, cbb3-type subunit III n=1 Tax=Aurantiacibacter sp. D1-12 TaxID=2993658 RepID=UPI00237D16BE|nr:cytochrome-c oxidase, cbb3-type subunit III [Aurantiacibacter sp. D1-12]MDE1467752.1 cytochrome-c oxidase, cbb3-type subunit III [Aurantiacibacter sp. D1-12]
MATNKRIDEPTGTETVGHEWDGIEELDTPMPRWWLWTFYLCILFSAVYVVLYPAWPLVDRATTGILNWSSRGDLQRELVNADEARQAFRAELAEVEVADLRADEELFRRAVAGGEAAFKVHCSQCHGSQAAGVQNLGYPSLSDDDWLWGGTLEDIHYSITYGIRQPDNNDQRQSLMPSFDGLLDAGQLAAVTSHVQSLSGIADADPAGAGLYEQNCAVCHGAMGEGDRDLGAPQLNDAVWLRGSSTADITQQILHPRMGAMPAWGERLGPSTVKMLTAYVYSLGGGEDAVAPPADEQAVAEVEVESGGQ